ncbi:hypothetical protein [Chitinophaga sp. CF418]|uniref:hypothetical protein n=1 Tax=Chitinophaga sp. CF418 TaxID=1855287 RepID=UPI000912DF14|nr:hypothetical protein [Chitinophaga sp. CF418]SHN33470.1 hypothetical protein SAMN05216311_109174 [Chitinophaga sp. CF418]
MKSILTATVVLLLSLHSFFVHAQDRPEFPELEVKEDYAKSEALFQQVTTWLTETDLDKQEALRMESNVFILKWITGSPTVTVGIDEHIVRLVDKNSQLLAIFMANYASFCISNKENKSTLDPNKAGLLAMVKVYKKGIGIQKTKALDKLATAADKNELDDYIAKNLKSEVTKH